MMKSGDEHLVVPSVAHVFDAPDAAPREAIPVWLVAEGTSAAEQPEFKPEHRRWLEQAMFTGAARKQALLPDASGAVSGVVLGLGNGRAGDPSGPSDLLVGQLAQSLHPGNYRLAGSIGNPELAALAWGLGAYRYRRYKSKADASQARLQMPAGVDRSRVTTAVEAVWFGRDLINTPSNDLGPEEIETAVRALGRRHGATVTSIVGDDLLTENFPLIHAVGRASPRAPRLIELTWGRESAPAVTLVGKGIAFDTGGLDLKPSSAMLLMKKDMGGAATALSLGHMIMGNKLDCRLRILIPAAENAVAGNAFRPSDVLVSRAGISVEVGNTDAEGRLVLADALALADAAPPKLLFTFATLTGAARVALGPEIPALFSDDAGLAADLVAAGERVGDPMWRLPFWSSYDRMLDSEVADMNNVSESPFAGAVIAALFLRRFVRNSRRYAHIDLYGWRTAQRPLGPKGGEPQTARAVFDCLERELKA